MPSFPHCCPHYYNYYCPFITATLSSSYFYFFLFFFFATKDTCINNFRKKLHNLTYNLINCNLLLIFLIYSLFFIFFTTFLTYSQTHSSPYTGQKDLYFFFYIYYQTKNSILVFHILSFSLWCSLLYGWRCGCFIVCYAEWCLVIGWLENTQGNKPEMNERARARDRFYIFYF